MFNQQKHITLNELCNNIKSALKNHLEPVYWVVAEISDLRSNYTGHCYLELIEKDKQSDTIIAKSRATIWSSTYRMLRPYFESSTNQKLQAGISVLIKVSVEYHSIYGFSLNIKDIDPVYTLGEQERKRIAIIKQLEEEGIINMNLELPMPEIIQSIAIISSEQAAGYGDFMQQLRNNTHGFSFKTTIFAATMQGENAVPSIIAQLDRIYEMYHQFDAVVIIRGGGAVSDLICFDNYDLAANIAQFPLPVITGIGHDRDKTIADIVAHTSVKTPTAAAEFILEQALLFQGKLINLQKQLNTALQRKITKEKEALLAMTHSLPNMIELSIEKRKSRLQSYRPSLEYALKSLTSKNKGYILSLQTKMDQSLINNTKHQNNRHTLSQIERSFIQSVSTRCDKARHTLALLTETVKTHDPIIQLAKGYSLTYSNGTLIKSIAELSEGEVVESHVSDGKFESKITNIKKTS